MQTWSRKRREAVFLAIVALFSVMPMRWPIESRPVVLAEFAAILLAGILAGFAKPRYAKISATALVFIPMVFAGLARYVATPVAFELTALTCFGAFAIAIALTATSDRTRAMSLVVGGFLVLFCASISDDSKAIVYPLLWMTGCVWHLVANHWERLDLAMPESETTTWRLRPSLRSIRVTAAGLPTLSPTLSPLRPRLRTIRVTAAGLPTLSP
ncbi:MAG: transglutaminase domain-containing protein, partial [Planctomycetota bacterium]